VRKLPLPRVLLPPDIIKPLQQHDPLQLNRPLQPAGAAAAANLVLLKIHNAVEVPAEEDAGWGALQCSIQRRGQKELALALVTRRVHT
jgi:hypothetical protein